MLFISEDLDELFEISDRIVVLHGGEVAGVVDPAETDRYEVGRMMLGAGPESSKAMATSGRLAVPA